MILMSLVISAFHQGQNWTPKGVTRTPEHTIADVPPLHPSRRSGAKSARQKTGRAIAPSPVGDQQWPCPSDHLDQFMERFCTKASAICLAASASPCLIVRSAIDPAIPPHPFCQATPAITRCTAQACDVVRQRSSTGRLRRRMGRRKWSAEWALSGLHEVTDLNLASTHGLQ